MTQHILDVQASIQSDKRAMDRLVTLCDRYGHRLSGSDSLERALDWLEKTLRQDGFDSVTRQPVMVPRWERGKESLELVTPRQTPLAMLGLGGSIGTSSRGLVAPVVPVRDFSDLAAKAGTKARRAKKALAPQPARWNDCRRISSPKARPRDCPVFPCCPSAWHRRPVGRRAFWRAVAGQAG